MVFGYENSAPNPFTCKQKPIKKLHNQSNQLHFMAKMILPQWNDGQAMFAKFAGVFGTEYFRVS
jgi:hypothetical protein